MTPARPSARQPPPKLYGAALFVGTGRFQGEIAFWGPAAVLVAAPLVIGGLRERRA